MIKAKDLKIPYKPGKREPLFFDGVLAVPRHCDLLAYTFPGWQALFGNDNPVVIEYCSGNGAWIEQKAVQNPLVNYVACEIRLDRAKKIWAKAKKLPTGNLIVALAEGLLLTRHYIPAASLTAAYVNFPDPWPKRRHSKHRIISPAFANELARVLMPGGKIILTTDDVPYSEIMVDVFTSCSDFVSEIEAPYHSRPPEGYGSSFFRELFQSQEKPIHYHEFRRT